MESTQIEPRRIWWARPRKLCALERPGGGGRGHRADRRSAEIAHLEARGVRLVVSVMRTRHNLAAYDEAGLDWRHVPVPSAGEGVDQLEELLVLLRRETRRRGAIALHGDVHTDFVAAVCAAHLWDRRRIDPAESLAAASAAGLTITAAACALVGVRLREVGAAPPQPSKSRAASVSPTATGRGSKPSRAARS